MPRSSLCLNVLIYQAVSLPAPFSISLLVLRRSPLTSCSLMRAAACCRDLAWSFDLNGVAELYESYENTNLWGFLSKPAKGIPLFACPRSTEQATKGCGPILGGNLVCEELQAIMLPAITRWQHSVTGYGRQLRHKPTCELRVLGVDSDLASVPADFEGMERFNVDRIHLFAVLQAARAVCTADCMLARGRHG